MLLLSVARAPAISGDPRGEWPVLVTWYQGWHSLLSPCEDPWVGVRILDTLRKSLVFSTVMDSPAYAPQGHWLPDQLSCVLAPPPFPPAPL